MTNYNQLRPITTNYEYFITIKGDYNLKGSQALCSIKEFVSELFDKDRANREQNKTCFNYVEV